MEPVAPAARRYPATRETLRPCIPATRAPRVPVTLPAPVRCPSPWRPRPASSPSPCVFVPAVPAARRYPTARTRACAHPHRGAYFARRAPPPFYLMTRVQAALLQQQQAGRKRVILDAFAGSGETLLAVKIACVHARCVVASSAAVAAAAAEAADSDDNDGADGAEADAGAARRRIETGASRDPAPAAPAPATLRPPPRVRAPALLVAREA